MFSFNRKKIAEFLRCLPLYIDLAIQVPSLKERLFLIDQLKTISDNIECPHNENEILSFCLDMLKLPKDLDGCIVEAGAYEGGSTAKLSLFAKKTGRIINVFDSFCGMPPNDEPHEDSILGYSIDGWFSEGKFCASLEKVKTNIKKYGEIDVCYFVPGWFENTLPKFSKKIAALYLDVDLASSTRTCLKHLYPLLQKGGILYSQDGDFPLVIEVFQDKDFWENEVGVPIPRMEGLGKSKIIKIIKE